MRWQIRKPNPYNAWRRWFAWYPVRVDDQMVWWEYVERRRARLQNLHLDPHRAMESPDLSYVETGFWEYRFPAPATEASESTENL